MEVTLVPPELQESNPAAMQPSPVHRKRSIWRIVKNVLWRVIHHDCSEIAGEMAFDFLFAMFPAALFTATLILYLGIPAETVVNHSI